jgi:hypothetical protein
MYGLIGLLFIVYGWVFFNVSGSLVTLPKVLTQDTNKQGLVDSAAINTIVALSAAIISSLLFLREKLKINVFIECVLSVILLFNLGWYNYFFLRRYFDRSSCIFIIWSMLFYSDYFYI